MNWTRQEKKTGTLKENKHKRDHILGNGKLKNMIADFLLIISERIMENRPRSLEAQRRKN